MELSWSPGTSLVHPSALTGLVAWGLVGLSFDCLQGLRSYCRSGPLFQHLTAFLVKKMFNFPLNYGRSVKSFAGGKVLSELTWLTVLTQPVTGKWGILDQNEGCFLQGARHQAQPCLWARFGDDEGGSH